MQAALTTQKLSVHRFINPTAINDNATYTSTAFDCNGSDGIWIIYTLGVTDIAMAVLKVQESDTLTDATTLASATDIPGADFSVSPLTLPSATADNTSVGVYIPFNGNRKRYINVLATNGNGSLGGYATCIGIYGKREVPNTAAERGLAQEAIVAG